MESDLVGLIDFLEKLSCIIILMIVVIITFSPLRIAEILVNSQWTLQKELSSTSSLTRYVHGRDIVSWYGMLSLLFRVFVFLSHNDSMAFLSFMSMLLGYTSCRDCYPNIMGVFSDAIPFVLMFFIAYHAYISMTIVISEPVEFVMLSLCMYIDKNADEILALMALN